MKNATAVFGVRFVYGWIILFFIKLFPHSVKRASAIRFYFSRFFHYHLLLLNGCRTGTQKKNKESPT